MVFTSYTELKKGWVMGEESLLKPPLSSQKRTNSSKLPGGDAEWRTGANCQLLHGPICCIVKFLIKWHKYLT